MHSFLEKIARYVIDEYGENTGEICMVLPNKRASLFLKDHFRKIIDKPMWLPEIYGAEDFIEVLSDFELIDNLTQLFELYYIHRQETGDEAESLDEFMKWGQVLLHDFNEIDRYMIRADKLFSYVSEARAIEVWNTGGEELTDFQQQYLKFWKELGNYYEKYKHHLLMKNQAYQGMAFRKSAEEIKENPSEFIENKIPWKKVLFIGFNALTKAEETIVSLLEKENKGEALWDIDRYYYENPSQEAGLFLRRYGKKTGASGMKWFSENLKNSKKKINITGVPKRVGQAKMAGQVLKDMHTGAESDPQDTAVVLADESLLSPLLQSLPENIKTTNITMGYPLDHTGIYSLFNAYFRCLVNSERLSTRKNEIYHKDLIHLFRQPVMKKLFPGSEEIIQLIIEKNLIFLNRNSFSEILKSKSSGGKELDWIFPLDDKTKVTCIQQCLVYADKIKEFFSTSGEEKEDKKDEEMLEREALFIMTKVLNQVNKYIETYPWIESVTTLYHLIRQVSSGEKVAFYGEPLKGLQIMGMLETRTLDFKKIILLSANEGVLPEGKSQNSFIPFDIKREFHLPTHKEKDAIFAYHFYHLLQRAENIEIIYDIDMKDGIGKGEKSRFISQVIKELPEHNANCEINDRVAQVEVPPLKERETVIPKSKAISDGMRFLCKKGLSPSAIATYIKCPLDFYYKYILGLREVEEVEESIEASTMGEFIHHSLEELYQPAIGKVLQEKDIDAMLKSVDEVVENNFRKKFSKKELAYGKNLLSKKISSFYINNFLKLEKRGIKTFDQKIKLQSLESNFNTIINYNGSSTEVPPEIKFKGKADRIDYINNQYRIVDYKTGKVDSNQLKVKGISEMFEKESKDKCLQLMIYGWLAAKNNPAEGAVLPAIVSFRKLSRGFQSLSINGEKQITPELIKEFEEELLLFIEDFMDPEVPFRHNPSAKYCSFCE